jgi:hypothetical protein
MVWRQVAGNRHGRLKRPNSKSLLLGLTTWLRESDDYAYGVDSGSAWGVNVFEQARGSHVALVMLEYLHDFV